MCPRVQPCERSSQVDGIGWDGGARGRATLGGERLELCGGDERPSVHLPCRRSTQRATSTSALMSRPPIRGGLVYATRLPFDPGSRATGCASGRRTSYVEESWSPSL